MRTPVTSIWVPCIGGRRFWTATTVRRAADFSPSTWNAWQKCPFPGSNSPWNVEMCQHLIALLCIACLAIVACLTWYWISCGTAILCVRRMPSGSVFGMAMRSNRIARGHWTHSKWLDGRPIVRSGRRNAPAVRGESPPRAIEIPIPWPCDR